MYQDEIAPKGAECIYTQISFLKYLDLSVQTLNPFFVDHLLRENIKQIIGRMNSHSHTKNGCEMERGLR